MEKEKQWLTPEQQELRRRIEEHPLLTLPPEQRVGQTAQRMELLMLIMRLKKFDRKLERRNQSQDLAILADEQELHDSRVSRISRLAGKYDSVAFMSTIDKALLGYDASQGTPFLAYFDRIYVHELHRAANREDAINHQGRVALTSREGHLIKEMQRLSKVLGYHLKDLPHRYDEELARSLDLTPAQLRDLMEKADAVERFVSMDQMADSEDDSTPPCRSPTRTAGTPRRSWKTWPRSCGRYRCSRTWTARNIRGCFSQTTCCVPSRRRTAPSRPTPTAGCFCGSKNPCGIRFSCTGTLNSPLPRRRLRIASNTFWTPG